MTTPKTAAEFEQKAASQAQAWIEQSVRENKIVHVTAASDEEESELSAQSEGCSQREDSAEYWGTSEDGPWRVHIDAPIVSDDDDDWPYGRRDEFYRGIVDKERFCAD